MTGTALVFFIEHFQNIAHQNEKKSQTEKDDDYPQTENQSVAFQKLRRKILALFKIKTDDDKNDKKQDHGRHDQAHALDIFVFHSPNPCRQVIVKYKNDNPVYINLARSPPKVN